MHKRSNRLFHQVAIARFYSHFHQHVAAPPKQKVGVVFAKSKIAKMTPMLQERKEALLAELKADPSLDVKFSTSVSDAKESSFVEFEDLWAHADAVDSVIVAPLTGGTEQALSRVVEMRKPTLLYGFSTGNSLAAAIELREFYRNHYIPTKLVSNLKDAKETLQVYSENKQMIEKFLNLRLGLIGKISPWLINEKFFYPYIEIPMQHFKDEYKNVSDEDSLHVVKAIVSTASRIENIKDADLIKAGKSIIALEKIIKEYQLDGFTMGCFDLLDEITSTPCLALSVFNATCQSNVDQQLQDLIPYFRSAAGCEGELNSLMGITLIKLFFNEPVFMANLIDFGTKNHGTNSKELTLAHCTAPVNFTPFNLMSHYESGMGVSVNATMAHSATATIFKIRNKRVIVSRAEVKPVDHQHHSVHACRTQIKVVLPIEAEDFVDQTLGNHHLICYVDPQRVANMFDVLGFDVNYI